MPVCVLSLLFPFFGLIFVVSNRLYNFRRDAGDDGARRNVFRDNRARAGPRKHHPRIHFVSTSLWQWTHTTGLPPNIAP